MATNDDLDIFFQKKDRKGQKHKKQTCLLTNNEELLKQLKNVTSAQREYVDIDEDADELSSNVMNYPSIISHSAEFVELSDGKYPSSKTKTNNRTAINVNVEKPNKISDQQEEWEDYEESMNKLEELRLKLNGNHADRVVDDDEDEFFDDHFENMRETSFDDGSHEKFIRAKEKMVWKVEQVTGATNADFIDTLDNNRSNVHQLSNLSIEEGKSMNSGVYRAPHLRNTKSSVNIVCGHNQKKMRKDKPNIASTEEFPTLGAGNFKKP